MLKLWQSNLKNSNTGTKCQQKVKEYTVVEWWYILYTSFHGDIWATQSQLDVGWSASIIKIRSLGNGVVLVNECAIWSTTTAVFVDGK